MTTICFNILYVTYHKVFASCRHREAVLWKMEPSCEKTKAPDGRKQASRYSQEAVSLAKEAPRCREFVMGTDAWLLVTPYNHCSDSDFNTILTRHEQKLQCNMYVQNLHYRKEHHLQDRKKRIQENSLLHDSPNAYQSY